MKDVEALRPGFDRVQRRSLIVGIVGMAVLAVGAFISTQQFFQSYLYGFLMWVGLTIGCLGILLLHHLVSGHWGNVIQRFVEPGARNAMLMLALFLPVLIGADLLYPWTNHDIVEKSHTLHQKAGYLNTTFFTIRGIAFFMLWGFIAWWLTTKSREQDRTADGSLTRKMKIFSGPMMVTFVLSVSFASVDWMMSLEPEWYSTIYGMFVIVGSVLTALAFCILMLSILADRKPFSEVLTTRHHHHLGNLLMAFTILWAYMAFSQFLIIWSGNLPEDNFWYIRRMGNGWNIIAVILMIGHFFVPLFVLLNRGVKRNLRTLAKMAVWILVMRFVDMFWLIMPAFGQEYVSWHPLDVVAPTAIGGLWIAAFLAQLKKHPLIPLNDPRFEGEAH